MAKIVLYDWPPSPFCMKVRAVLARKGVAYERVPALSRVREVERRGGVGKVPALDVDGTMLVDSTDICHALEDWADEGLYFLGLWHHWHEPAGRAQARRYFAKTLLGRIMFRPYLSRIEGQLKGQGTGRKSDAHVRADMERSLDAIERMLDGREWLLGSGPNLCDFAVAAQLTYLARAPATREVLRDRTATQAFLKRLPEVRV